MSEENVADSANTIESTKKLLLALSKAVVRHEDDVEVEIVRGRAASSSCCNSIHMIGERSSENKDIPPGRCEPSSAASVYGMGIASTSKFEASDALNPLTLHAMLLKDQA